MFKAQLVNLKSDLIEAKAFKNTSERELERLMIELHSCQLQIQKLKSNQTYNSYASYASSFMTNSPNTSSSNSSQSAEDTADLIQKKLKEELDRRFSLDDDHYSTSLLREDLSHVKKENLMFKEQIVQLTSEVYGARLAAKYLDKELAGRVQQIQLFGKNLKSDQHERLWNQLEAEIHLQRHKTVLRACRGKRRNDKTAESPAATSSPLPQQSTGEFDNLKKNQLMGVVRIVTLTRKSSKEGLGISITGGREHGVPILISEIHGNGPAARSGELYVGDAILAVNGIDLKDAQHSEAVETLSNLVNEFIQVKIFIF